MTVLLDLVGISQAGNVARGEVRCHGQDCASITPHPRVARTQEPGPSVRFGSGGEVRTAAAARSPRRIGPVWRSWPSRARPEIGPFGTSGRRPTLGKLISARYVFPTRAP